MSRAIFARGCEAPACAKAGQGEGDPEWYGGGRIPEVVDGVVLFELRLETALFVVRMAPSSYAPRGSGTERDVGGKPSCPCGSGPLKLVALFGDFAVAAASLRHLGRLLPPAPGVAFHPHVHEPLRASFAALARPARRRFRPRRRLLPIARSSWWLYIPKAHDAGGAPTRQRTRRRPGASRGERAIFEVGPATRRRFA